MQKFTAAQLFNYIVMNTKNESFFLDTECLTRTELLDILEQLINEESEQLFVFTSEDVIEQYVDGMDNFANEYE